MDVNLRPPSIAPIDFLEYPSLNKYLHEVMKSPPEKMVPQPGKTRTAEIDEIAKLQLPKEVFQFPKKKQSVERVGQIHFFVIKIIHALKRIFFAGYRKKFDWTVSRINDALKCEMGALSFQKCFRGWRVRKKLPAVRKEVDERKAAALTIQKNVKGYCAVPSARNAPSARKLRENFFKVATQKMMGLSSLLELVKEYQDDCQSNAIRVPKKTGTFKDLGAFKDLGKLKDKLHETVDMLKVNVLSKTDSLIPKQRPGKTIVYREIKKIRPDINLGDDTQVSEIQKQFEAAEERVYKIRQRCKGFTLLHRLQWTGKADSDLVQPETVLDEAKIQPIPVKNKHKENLLMDIGIACVPLQKLLGKFLGHFDDSVIKSWRYVKGGTSVLTLEKMLKVWIYDKKDGGAIFVLGQLPQNPIVEIKLNAAKKRIIFLNSSFTLRKIERGFGEVEPMICSLTYRENDGHIIVEAGYSVLTLDQHLIYKEELIAWDKPNAKPLEDSQDPFEILRNLPKTKG